MSSSSPCDYLTWISHLHFTELNRSYSVRIWSSGAKDDKGPATNKFSCQRSCLPIRIKPPCFCNRNVESSAYLMYNILSGIKGFFNSPTVPSIVRCGAQCHCPDKFASICTHIYFLLLKSGLYFHCMFPPSGHFRIRSFFLLNFSASSIN